MDEWTPAIIATREHTLKFHRIDPGGVTRFAGKKIRVKPIDDVDQDIARRSRTDLGCKGRMLWVHPDDAVLWESMFKDEGLVRVVVCECQILTD